MVNLSREMHEYVVRFVWSDLVFECRLLIRERIFAYTGAQVRDEIELC